MYFKVVFLKRNNLILISALAHLLAVMFSVGYHQCDELFQVFEFAGLKLGLNAPASLPWEYEYHMRSALPPLLVYSITSAAHAINLVDPFFIAMSLRFLVAALSFAGFVRLLKLQSSDGEIKNDVNALWLVALLFWPIPYFHVRLSAENLSATLFVWSFVLNQEFGGVWKKYILPGVLMALTFHIRFQMAFMILPFGLWLAIVHKEKLKSLLLLVAGFGIGFCLATAVDYWFYGQFTFSWWNYIYQNIFESKAEQFGVEPFYFYLRESAAHLIPPFSLLIILGIALFWWKKRWHVLTWITLPFVLIHFFVGHKEFRFLFPIMNFVPFILVVARKELLDWKLMMRVLDKKWLIKLYIASNCVAMLIFCLSPADSATRKMRQLYYLQESGTVNVLVNGESPYSQNLGLNYFHNSRVHCYNDTLLKVPACNWYYTEDFNKPDSLFERGTLYIRYFSSIPRKAAYFDFNGWMSRVPYFSIYKAEGTLTE